MKIRFGPADAVDARPDGLVVPRRTARGWRRSIYVQQQRKIVVTGLESFDFPLMNPNCSDRRDSTVVLQALHLWNNAWSRNWLKTSRGASNPKQEQNLPARIERIYLVALGRPPEANELAQGQFVAIAIGRSLGCRAGRRRSARPNSGGPQGPDDILSRDLELGGFLYVD